MMNQLKSLFGAIVSKKNDETPSLLSKVALSVIQQQADIDAAEMSLSTFNVQLSSSHGKCFIPVVSFPAQSVHTDKRNAITSSFENFIISESKADNNVAQALRYIIDEQIDNVTEHADTSRGYICAEWSSKEISVCIADGGKTVYGSYADMNFDQIKDDQTALQAATMGMSTKNRPGAETRGFGISTSTDMIVKGFSSSMIIFFWERFILTR